MDTITQMAFGAVVGQAGWRKRFGRWSLAAGALAALLPDLDVIIQTGDPFAGWIYHRGISHSIVVAPLIGLLAGFSFWYYFNRKYQKGDRSLIDLAERKALGAWLWLGVMAVTTHIWLDVMTPYGTQIFAPLSDTRFALNAMPIIDLTYTAILVVAITMGVSIRVPARIAQAVAGVAIFASVIWQVFAWNINEQAEMKARAQFDSSAQVTSYPTLFTPYLRRINVELPEQIYIGFWNGAAEKIDWRVFPKQAHPLTEKFKETRAFRIFYWFARQKIFWRIHDKANGGVRIEAHDMRYLTNLPSDPPQTPLKGLWGVRQDFDKNGNPQGDASRFTNRPSPKRYLEFFFGD